LRIQQSATALKGTFEILRFPTGDFFAPRRTAAAPRKAPIRLPSGPPAKIPARPHDSVRAAASRGFAGFSMRGGGKKPENIGFQGIQPLYIALRIPVSLDSERTFEHFRLVLLSKAQAPRIGGASRGGGRPLRIAAGDGRQPNGKLS
jgi:hypothetical protein